MSVLTKLSKQPVSGRLARACCAQNSPVLQTAVCFSSAAAGSPAADAQLQQAVAGLHIGAHPRLYSTASTWGLHASAALQLRAAQPDEYWLARRLSVNRPGPGSDPGTKDDGTQPAELLQVGCLCCHAHAEALVAA